MTIFVAGQYLVLAVRFANAQRIRTPDGGGTLSAGPGLQVLPTERDTRRAAQSQQGGSLRSAIPPPNKMEVRITVGITSAASAGFPTCFPPASSCPSI